MKSCISVLFVIFTSQIFAQSISLFPNDTAYFNIEVGQLGGTGTTMVYDEEKIRFEPLNGSPDTSVALKYTNDTVAFIKQENDKVWIKPGPQGYSNPYAGWDNNMDADWSVLYDYDVNVGDTLYEGHGWVYVTSIDSIQFGIEMRKAIHTSHGDEIWIEGFGSTLHPFITKLYQFENSFYLNCAQAGYQHDNEVKYYEFGLSNCRSLGLEENLDEAKLIYPNPVQVGATLNIPMNGIQKISMFSALGKETILSKRSNGEFTLSKEITPGVYWVQWTNGQEVFNQKVQVRP